MPGEAARSQIDSGSPFRLSGPAPDFSLDLHPDALGLHMRSKLALVALRTALLYALAGAMWILLSDSALEALFSDHQTISTLQTYKGGAFVAVTAMLLYAALRTQLARHAREAVLRQEVEASLRRTSRTLRMVTECNQAIVRAADEQSLLARICEIVCSFGGYQNAWVGFAEQDEAKSVVVAAAAGATPALADQLQVSWADTPRGRGPTGQAIRTGRACAIHDVATDPTLEPWRELTPNIGHASVCALPLRAETGTLGSLTVYSAQREVFTDEEIALLQELADDVAFGIMALRIRASHAQAQAALEESEANLNEAQRLAKIGNWIWHPDGSLFWSKAMWDLFPLAAGVHLSFETFLTAVHAEEREAVRVGFDEWIKSGRVHNEVEYRVLGPGGVIRTILAMGNVQRDDTGRVRRAVGTCQDITERKRLEAELRQVQKLEAVGRLAGGVAHDFNNILAAMLINVGLLQETPGLDPDVRMSLKELEAGAKRAASLTRQLLLFSRRSVIQTQPLDLNEAIENLLKMLRRLIGEDIKLQFSPQNAVPMVEADPGMLDQVMMNLVVNARDAMPQGGRLTVLTAAVEFAAAEVRDHPDARPGSFVRLTVADTGSGMEEATLKHIFEPFFTTKPPGQGTGLGLATVYGVVQQHRGWIAVESKPGQGARFDIYLPVLPASPATRAAELPADAVPRGSETILLVEDDAAVRLTLGNILRRWGYRVIEAVSGVEALRRWEKHRQEVALLLTDVVMPEGLNGIDLARQLKAAKPALKVIVSSGYSADLVQERGAMPPEFVYVPKPCPAPELGAIIRRCLDRPL